MNSKAGNLARKRRKFLSPEEKTIAGRQGASEEQKFAAKLTPPKTNFCVYLCIALLFSLGRLEIPDKVLYLSAGIIFESASVLSRLGWGGCLLFPWATTAGRECLFLSNLCDAAAQRAFSQIFKRTPSPSTSSWIRNQTLLSQIPASSDEDKLLLRFLEKKWLAKMGGVRSTEVDWACPCFGITMQVHPETTSTYVRDPSLGFSMAYKNRMENWKQSLPHPLDFPLILTRSFDIQDYLPSHVVDLTHVITEKVPEKWLQEWKAYQDNKAFYIERVQQENIGGLRLLPNSSQSEEETASQYRFLLEWISNFGLTANRIELDRWPLSSDTRKAPNAPVPSLTKEEFASALDSFAQNWTTDHPQKAIMIQGTQQVLQGLLVKLSEAQWSENATKAAVAQLSFFKIREQLNILAQEGAHLSFFDTAMHLEQIHADLSALLEIASPFEPHDFPKIYRSLLTIPVSLKPLASYGILSSGMTSLAGIFKAAEQCIGKPLRVLYGENSYFECIHAANMASNASPIVEATVEDWKEVDLILAQFNPALRRIDLKTSEYQVEMIEETLYKCLNVKRVKPVTVALDCTLDFIDSERVARLLSEFQEPIERGDLNIVCYRSGIKFDLFGMDNYCGAPFYMIHNQDAKWAPFDALSTNPVLQTDRLSLNWFCLAYGCAAPQLELYRKQIFDNTRALLNKIPPRLFADKSIDYRVIPIEQGADPAFIDFKIYGCLHQLRAAALAGGGLYMACMEGGQPVFFRPGLGFYHPNFSMLFGDECTTIRLTLGLDPAQVDVLAEYFQTIDGLNGPLEEQKRLLSRIENPRR